MSLGRIYYFWEKKKANLKNRFTYKSVDFKKNWKEISMINVKLTVLKYCSMQEIENLFSRKL